MKNSWSLSCFGALGKRDKTFSGNLNAKIVIAKKKSIKKLNPFVGAKKRKKHVKSAKDIDGKVRQTFLSKKKKSGKSGS